MEAKHTATPWMRNGLRIMTSDAQGQENRRIVAKMHGLNTEAGPIDNMFERLPGHVQVANAEFIVRACNVHDALVSDLQAAEHIISVMLCELSTEQQCRVTSKLNDGLTRFKERRAALTKAGAEP
jgi:hypothetical protein